MKIAINYAAFISLFTCLFADEAFKFNNENVEDKSHLQEHLDQMADLKTEDMSKDQLRFHYFKLHDADNNNKLDGIEMMKSMMDHHHHEKNNPDIEKPAPLTDDEYSKIVDNSLKKFDLNNDGYIDYQEWKYVAKSENTPEK